MISIADSSLQIFKDIIYMMGVEEYFNITENTLSCKNGAKFVFKGAKVYQSFKSLQGINLVFIDEATELSEKAWEFLLPTIRADNSRFLISFNPELTTDTVYDMFVINKHPDAVIFDMNYDNNPFFPEVLDKKRLVDKSKNLAKYKHIWLGELINLTVGALWNQSMFNYVYDIDVNAAFEKIIIAIDPSGTSKATSDACGLVVAGKYIGIDRYCVLEDMTKIMSPDEWASKAVALYNKYEANKIIYETNFGADIVKALIRSVDRNVPIEGVRATKGKILRAEPVVALYEQSKVDHLDGMVGLEYECTTFTGDPKDVSPNRLDAMVYAIMYLSKNKKKMSIPTIKFNI